MLRRILQDFMAVPRNTLYLLGVIFCIQIIDSAAFILMNYHLQGLGYSDERIANLTAYRYAAIVILAFPFGLFIKGRRLVPFFKIAAILTPSCTLAILWALQNSSAVVINGLMFIFGISLIFSKVTALPYIILNTPQRYHSEAFAMFFQTFSLTAFLTGTFNYVFNTLNPGLFTEGNMLIGFALFGYAALYFAFKIPSDEMVSESVAMRQIKAAYDWKKIFIAVFPTLLIAIGAGLTIPFLNLFFKNVHGIDSRNFSFYISCSFVLVTLMTTFVPYIRRRFGYNMVINGFQILAIIALFVMASTEWYADWKWASTIALAAFLLRQPLMNVASPASSELTMYYVGERNQEMIGALNASIWSGSWFFSSVIFGWLRGQQVSYVNIFMLTVGLYLISCGVYYWLIKDYYKNKKKTKSPEPEPSAS